MPDIYGKYSLIETAKLLNVTPAFINRIQRETGVGGRIGIKGQPASFDAYRIEAFRRIKILRKMEFSFKEIKEIAAIENRMLELYKNMKIAEGETEKWDDFPLIVHAPIKIRCPSETIKTDHESVKNYALEAVKLIPIAQEIKRRAGVFQKEVEEVKTAMKELMPDWDDIIKHEKISTDKV